MNTPQTDADARALTDAAGRRYWQDAEFHARVMVVAAVVERGQPHDGFDRFDLGAVKIGASVALHLADLEAGTVR